MLQAKVDEENAKYAAERKGQIGTGDRSERIARTTIRRASSRIIASA